MTYFSRLIRMFWLSRQTLQRLLIHIHWASPIECYAFPADLEFNATECVKGGVTCL